MADFICYNLNVGKKEGKCRDWLRARIAGVYIAAHIIAVISRGGSMCAEKQKKDAIRLHGIRKLKR